MLFMVERVSSLKTIPQLLFKTMQQNTAIGDFDTRLSCTGRAAGKQRRFGCPFKIHPREYPLSFREQVEPDPPQRICP